MTTVAPTTEDPSLGSASHLPTIPLPDGRVIMEAFGEKIDTSASSDRLPVVELRPFMHREWRPSRSLPDYYERPATSMSSTSARGGIGPDPEALGLYKNRQGEFGSRSSLAGAREATGGIRVRPKEGKCPVDTAQPGMFATTIDRERTTFEEMRAGAGPAMQFACVRRALSDEDMIRQQDMRVHGRKLENLPAKLSMFYMTPYEYYRLHRTYRVPSANHVPSANPEPSMLEELKLRYQVLENVYIDDSIYDTFDRSNTLPSIQVSNAPTRRRRPARVAPPAAAAGAPLTPRSSASETSRSAPGSGKAPAYRLGVANSLDVLRHFGKPSRVESHLNTHLKHTLTQLRRTQDLSVLMAQSQAASSFGGVGGLSGGMSALGAMIAHPSQALITQKTGLRSSAMPTYGETMLRAGMEANVAKRQTGVNNIRAAIPSKSAPDVLSRPTTRVRSELCGVPENMGSPLPERAPADDSEASLPSHHSPRSNKKRSAAQGSSPRHTTTAAGAAVQPGPTAKEQATKEVGKSSSSSSSAKGKKGATGISRGEIPTPADGGVTPRRSRPPRAIPREDAEAATAEHPSMPPDPRTPVHVPRASAGASLRSVSDSERQDTSHSSSRPTYGSQSVVASRDAGGGTTPGSMSGVPVAGLEGSSSMQDAARAGGHPEPAPTSLDEAQVDSTTASTTGSRGERVEEPEVQKHRENSSNVEGGERSIPGGASPITDGRVTTAASHAEEPGREGVPLEHASRDSVVTGDADVIENGTDTEINNDAALDAQMSRGEDAVHTMARSSTQGEAERRPASQQQGGGPDSPVGDATVHQMARAAPTSAHNEEGVVEAESASRVQNSTAGPKTAVGSADDTRDDLVTDGPVDGSVGLSNSLDAELVNNSPSGGVANGLAGDYVHDGEVDGPLDGPADVTEGGAAHGGPLPEEQRASPPDGKDRPRPPVSSAASRKAQTKSAASKASSQGYRGDAVYLTSWDQKTETESIMRPETVLTVAEDLVNE